MPMRRSLMVLAATLASFVTVNAWAASPHTSTGIIAPMGQDSRIVEIQDVAGDMKSTAFYVTEETRILGPDNEPWQMAELQDGYFVEEECFVGPDGKHLLQVLKVLTADSPYF